jgi:cell wall-associated NlpC family hydrolase
VTTTLDRAKHRGTRRSPISALSQSVASPAARRGALVTASSGLVLTMAATTATAAPQAQDLATAEAGATTLTDSALESLALSPAVVVPDDVSIAFDEITVSAKPAPEPEPEPVVATSSRTSTRTAPADATATYEGAYSSATGERIVAIAKQYVGVPYVYGGATPAGFDCSGFTSFVYAQVGISIPRSSSGQHALGGRVPASAAPVGALMTWDGHTGIYLGGGMHIAARQPGTPLSISPIYRSGAVYHVLF